MFAQPANEPNKVACACWGRNKNKNKSNKSNEKNKNNVFACKLLLLFLMLAVEFSCTTPVEGSPGADLALAHVVGASKGGLGGGLGLAHGRRFVVGCWFAHIVQFKRSKARISLLKHSMDELRAQKTYMWTRSNSTHTHTDAHRYSHQC